MFDKSRWRLGSENPTLEKWNFSKSTLLRRFEPKPYRYTRSAMYHNKAGRGYNQVAKATCSERRAFALARKCSVHRHRRKGGVKSRKR